MPANSSVRQFAEAQRELQIRAARKRFLPYVHYTYPDYRANWHHHKIADALEAVYDGDLLRLMVFMPPRYGKSLLISKRFPGWVLGRDPHLDLIANAYGGRLASDVGRELRNLMAGMEHLQVFPRSGLSEHSKARDRWNTAAGGGYLAAGLEGGITGFGFQIGIVDDPVQGHEAADSPHQREMAWLWYNSDFYTRRMPRFITGKRVPAAVVVVQTRWHDDDLAGRLLNNESKSESYKWHVLSYPAMGHEADGSQTALWEEQFPLWELELTKADTIPRVWQSLYQQNPTPDEGAYFMREWFGYADPPPRQHMRIYAASDYATKFQEGDYTVHVIVGVTPEDDIHILDVWRRQAESDTWIEVAVGMMERWEPIVWAEESGQIEKSVGPFLRKQMLERKVYCRRQQFPSAADKATRARSIQGRWAMRKVYFPRTRPDWLPELEAELLKFPLGANDDQVDALSLIGRMVAGLQPGKVPTISERMGILHYPPDGTIEQVDLNSDDARLMLDLGWKPGKPPHAVPGVSEVSIDRLWEDRDKERPGWR